MAGAEPTKVVCKAHIKDICFTRMYIGGHFDAPFENYRLDAAVFDLAGGTGVPRESLLPLTCFLFKGYLWTLNNRRLWVLRHAFMFTGKDEEVDVVILPDNAMPERKDYVIRLPFHKQEALVNPGYLPVIHGDQPKLQKLVLRPIFFRFDQVMRTGYKMLPGGRLLGINGSEAAVAFRATGVKLPPPQAQHPAQQAGQYSSPHSAHHAEHDDDDTMSMLSETPSMQSVDFPGRVSDYRSSWNQQGKGLPALKETEEEAEGEEEEVTAKGKEMVLKVTEAGLKEGLTAGQKKELREVAQNFKAAVTHLRAVLDNLDAAFDKLAA